MEPLMCYIEFGELICSLVVRVSQVDETQATELLLCTPGGLAIDCQLWVVALGVSIDLINHELGVLVGL